MSLSKLSPRLSRSLGTAPLIISEVSEFFRSQISRLTGLRQVASPPTGGKYDDGGGEPSGGVHGLSAPLQDRRMHQTKPGEDRCDQAPNRGAPKIPVDHFRDQSGNDEHEEQETVAESLQGRPIY